MSRPVRSANLSNWRKTPYNRWAFHHVRDLIPTANIRNDPATAFPLDRKLVDLDDWMFSPQDADPMRLQQVLENTWTDAFLVLHQGRIAYEWLAPHYAGTEPHILFSVSKSVTGALAGVLVEQGSLDPGDAVLKYVPEVAGSAFEDCSVRNVLDMQTGLDFEEIYTGESVQFNRYRASTGWDPLAAGEEAGDLASFLCSLEHSQTPHGQVFQYMSPNTDLLGLILEAASGMTFAELMSRYMWEPLGAESPAYITVDKHGAPRTAGGICTCLTDLARLGQAKIHGGRFNDKQVIPEHWVQDIRSADTREAWVRSSGSLYELIPEGCYRSQWYQLGNANGAICAIGIHGQWIYADPTADVVMVKFSSQPDPLDDPMDAMCLALFDQLVNSLG